MGSALSAAHLGGSGGAPSAQSEAAKKATSARAQRGLTAATAGGGAPWLGPSRAAAAAASRIAAT
eukprot:scaffold130204_cov27-Phaeocystis_antarctica.AAC.1